MNTALEADLNVRIDENRPPLTPSSVISLDEQLRAAVRGKNYPREALAANEKGQIIVDKDKDPDLYDFAVNG